MRTIPPPIRSIELRDRLSELLKDALRTERGAALLYLLCAFTGVARGRRQDEVSRDVLIEVAERAFCAARIEVPTSRALDELLAARLLRYLTQESEQARLVPGEELQTELSAATHRIEAYCRVLQGLSQRSYCSIDPAERVLEDAACLFNEGLFFEVHEILEAVWLTHGEAKVRRLLQGLIQIAVGFHHLERNNLRGALSLLQEGVDKVNGAVPYRSGLELNQFLAKVKDARYTIELLGGEAFNRFDRQLIPQMQLLERTLVNRRIAEPGVRPDR